MARDDAAVMIPADDFHQTNTAWLKGFSTLEWGSSKTSAKCFFCCSERIWKLRTVFSGEDGKITSSGHSGKKIGFFDGISALLDRYLGQHTHHICSYYSFSVKDHISFTLVYVPLFLGCSFIINIMI